MIKKVNESTPGDKLKTQRKSIKALKKMLTYYQDITDTIREPFIILDNSLHTVTANVAFYDTFKVKKANTEKKLIYELGNNQWDSPKLRELLEDILPKHKVFNNFEITQTFPNIGRRTMLLNARQVDSQQLILLAIVDITTPKKLQADSNKMTANLVKQHRDLQSLSDAKDEFIALASHQLRTPATVVQQYAGMLSEGYAGKLSKEQGYMLDSVILSNQRQLEIIEDLLRVARVDAGKVYVEKSDCDVVQLIEAVIQAQAVTFAKRVQKVIFNKPATVTKVFMDEKLMKMVIENLLDNAGKYSQSQTTITIETTQSDEHTTVSIKDNGVGILKNDLKKLFKKFSRIDNALSISTVGTGLGLYWAKKIVDLHNGTINVSSPSGQGTKFTVKLPNRTEMLAV